MKIVSTTATRWQQRMVTFHDNCRLYVLYSVQHACVPETIPIHGVKHLRQS